MNLDSMQATRQAIRAFHAASRLEQENPPGRMARVEAAGRVAEAWVAGLDSAYWYYRVASGDDLPTLVGHYRNKDEGFVPADPLLQKFRGASWPEVEDWQAYLEAWLGT